MKLYKVLGPGGQAYHGGTGAWPLPKDGQPGEWVRVEGPLVLCENGLHLTDQPVRWWKDGARVFEVEIELASEVVGSLQDGDHKIAVRAARLMKEADWADHRVWFAGEHQVSDGLAYAFNSATVEASESATVEASESATVWAYNSATVRASGSATVWAYDSATVRAYDSATVRAYNSATVRAFNSATVRASDSATVRAFDSATVRAFNSATVEASDSATVEASESATVWAYNSATVISDVHHSSSATVALSGMAAHVDRRNSKLELRRAN